MRRAEIERKTKETDVFLTLDLDGGDYKVETDCGFAWCLARIKFAADGKT